MSYQLLLGDALEVLRTLPSDSVQCAITSPPYFGLRDYLTATWEGGDSACDHLNSMAGPTRRDTNSPFREGRAGPGMVSYRDTCGKCGARRVDQQIGLEPTPEAYVAKLVDVFREVRRILHPTGVVFLNLGDSYNGSGGSGGDYGLGGLKEGQPKYPGRNVNGLGPKQLLGMPWRVAFALQADGWVLRSEIIWCLSGGTWVYARTQKGDMPMIIKDLARLNPATVQLWNGEKWTQLLGMSKSARRGDELELVLRSGERISCTPTHKFPTRRGLLEASQVQVGDVIEHCRLPEPETPLSPEHLTEEAAWFAGLYIAEGNRDDKAIHIHGHIREVDRVDRVRRIVEAYGGTMTVSTTGNGMTIHIRGRMLQAILDMLVSGEGAKKKGFSPVAWRYSNNFLSSMLDGYLSGDGHWDAPNNRWRLGFTRNYNLERDLRTVCARLGLHLTLKITQTSYNGGLVSTFRGEIRMDRSGHHNEKDMGEVVEIRKARCREVYDLGVEDEPHVFALASGILTHNSKKAPMPESVTDRPTKAHEQVFMLAKSASYFYDATAIMEPISQTTRDRFGTDDVPREGPNGQDTIARSLPTGRTRTLGANPSGRNKRSVWTLGPESYSGAHFATMPTKLVEPCILAGSSAHGCCAACGAPWERVVERTSMEVRPGPSREARSQNGQLRTQVNGTMTKPPTSTTIGWAATCTCGADVIPCTILDPFVGSGTVGFVSLRHGRNFVGIDLNADYLELARTRIEQSQPMLFAIA